MRRGWQALREGESAAARLCADYAALLAALAGELDRQGGNPVQARDAALHFLLYRLACRFAAPGALPGGPGADPSAAYRIPPAAEAAVAACLDAYTYTPEEQPAPEPDGAVDPSMLELLYARLGAENPGAAGVFYTARAEIALMIRLALVEYLTQGVGEAHRAALDAVVFAREAEARAAADAGLAAGGLWPAVAARLRALQVIDPACGCGAFLVALLALLDDLQARAARQLGQREPGPGRRARIIRENLRGVDVQAGACRVAAWRLALAARVGIGPSPGGRGQGEGEISTVRALSKGEISPSPHPRPPGEGGRPGASGAHELSLEEVEELLGCVIRCGDSFAVCVGEAGAYDLVIGNPPYVRQEQIADPAAPTTKTAYKAALARAVYRAFPGFFGYDAARDRAARPLDARSDLYIYFYFLGLALLRPGGALCFLTSNAWLDVEYGAALQEFLLRRGLLRLVLDSRAARSFVADVNTVIVLAAPAAADSANGVQAARFVQFAAPYPAVTAPGIFPAIATTDARAITPLYRVHPVAPPALLAAGQEMGAGRYAGGRWGGLYLRAPDIYWTVLARRAERLARLGEVATVRFGLKTGANSFFYLDAAQAAHWGIEPEYLQPCLFSLKEIARYEVDPATLARRLFVCRADPATLARREHQGALAYIAWGEAQGVHRRPSLRGRAPWYALPAQEAAHFVANRFLGARFGFPWIAGLPAGDVFFVGRFHAGEGAVGTALLNSTLAFLAAEVQARQTYGIGVAYLYGPELRGLLLPHPARLPAADQQALAALFAGMRRRPLLPLAAELAQPDRRALDALVFDALGLTSGEREGVAAALLALVAARLAKGKT